MSPKRKLQCAKLSFFSDDRRKAICCVSLRCNYEGSAKLSMSWRPKPRESYKSENKSEALAYVGSLFKAK
eukprot:6212357-Pleurochrysis_carterae.AAC.1